jgi:hypothetical protein
MADFAASERIVDVIVRYGNVFLLGNCSKDFKAVVIHACPALK